MQPTHRPAVVDNSGSLSMVASSNSWFTCVAWQSHLHTTDHLSKQLNLQRNSKLSSPLPHKVLIENIIVKVFKTILTVIKIQRPYYDIYTFNQSIYNLIALTSTDLICFSFRYFYSFISIYITQKTYFNKESIESICVKMHPLFYCTKYFKL